MRIYRILQLILAPAVLAGLLWRWMRGRESWTSLSERHGYGLPRPKAPTVWLHGASLGELTAARPLVEDIRSALPQASVVVTTNTDTARRMVVAWGDAGVQVCNAPLDRRGPVRRFLQRAHPAAAIILENELWPEKIVQCATSGVPVLVLGARMSENSARNWGRFGNAARQVMSKLTFVAPQDDASRDRFLNLGLSPEKLGPNMNLKAAVALPPPDQSELAALRQHFPRETTFLAASTHGGDEDLILQAFSLAFAQRPDLRLILAPRHPERAKDVIQLIEKHNLSFGTRSQNNSPNPGAAVFLADTIGEMPLWYCLAGTTIIGGSFSDRGGHTPVEPVQFRSRVVHGPDIANHRQAFDALHDADAAKLVAGVDDLLQVFAGVPSDSAADETRQRAIAAISALGNAAEARFVVTEMLRKTIEQER